MMNMKSLLPMALSLTGTSFLGATILPSNSAKIKDASSAYAEISHDSGTYKSFNLFDGTAADYSSNSKGVDTYIQYQFDKSVSFDSFVHVDRGTSSSNSHVSAYTLTFADKSTTSVNRKSQSGTGTIDPMGSLVTTTSVKFDIDKLGDGSTATDTNVGGMEVYFLRTPKKMKLITGVKAIASSVEHIKNTLAKTVDGKIAEANKDVFISQAGEDTFVDFDLGKEVHVGAFDYFDMLSRWQTKSFNMVFSVDATFGNEDDVTKSYTQKGTQSDEFAEDKIKARYVRFKVVKSKEYAGVNEMRFYEVVE